MILTILILLPLVGAVVTALLPDGLFAKRVGMAVSLATLGLGVLVASRYSLGGGMQFTETHTWIEALGVHYALGVDGLGLLMVLLTVGLVPLVLGASWRESDAEGNGGGKAFFAWTLALEALSLAASPPPTSSSRPRLRGDAHPGLLPHRRLRQAAVAAGRRRSS